MRRLALAVLSVVLLGLTTLAPVTAHAEGGWVTITGRVTDVAGNGIRKIRVEGHDLPETDPEWYRYGALTDDLGYYTMAVGPGTLYLEAEDPFYLNEFRTTFYPGTLDRSGAEALTTEADHAYQFNFTVASASSTGPSRSGLDTSSVTAVRTAYRSRVQAQLNVVGPTPPADQSDTCQPVGSDSVSAATLSATNFVRSLARLDPLSFDAALSEKTSRRTLILALNHTLTPGSTDRLPICNDSQILNDTVGSVVTDLGAGARGVSAIMSDRTDHVDDAYGYPYVPAGMAILDPVLTGIGAASSADYTALDPSYAQLLPDAYPYGERPGGAGLPLRTWPTPGYFPSALTPERWAVGLNNLSYDLGRASVQVQRTDILGQPVQQVTLSHQTARDAVWSMPTPPVPSEGKSVDYRVTLSGVHYRGGPATNLSYTVDIFDPRVRIPVTGAPKISGTARVGSVLTATAAWQVPGITTAYQWLRDGAAVPRATGRTFTLGAADVGHRLSVRLTGRSPSYYATTAVTGSTGAVVKKTATLAATATKPSRRTVKIAATVTASGESTVNGTVTVTEKGRKKGTITVRMGKGTLTLSAVARGRHTYTGTFNGTSRLTTATRNVTVTVR